MAESRQVSEEEPLISDPLTTSELVNGCIPNEVMSLSRDSHGLVPWVKTTGELPAMPATPPPASLPAAEGGGEGSGAVYVRGMGRHG